MASVLGNASSVGRQRLDEEDQIKLAEIAARRAAAEREARLYYTNQIGSYDKEIGQLQATIKQNELTELDKLLLSGIQSKIQRGEQLSGAEQVIVQKLNAVEQASSRIDELTNERTDIRDRFIGHANPVNPNAQIVPPQGQQPAQRRGAKPLDPRLQSAVDLLKSGKGTREQLIQSTSFTDAEKEKILQAAGKK